MTPEDIFTRLKHPFPGLEKSAAQLNGYPSWTVPGKSIGAVCELLRSVFSFDYLDFITAMDRSAASAGGRDVFEMIYLVSALTTGQKVCLRCEIPRRDPDCLTRVGAIKTDYPGQPSIPSLYGTFKAADWQEREVYDMFGIYFEGHPNLKRILTPETQQGYPLRKDYTHTADVYD